MNADLQQRLTRALIDSLAEAQTRCGREVQQMQEDTVPLLHLVGFDSHNGVEVELFLSEKLGVEVENLPFRVGRRGTRELSIREIVEQLYKRYKATLTRTTAEELVAH